MGRGSSSADRESQRLFLAANSLAGVLLASEIDRLENLIRDAHPEIRFIDLEPM